VLIFGVVDAGYATGILFGHSSWIVLGIIVINAAPYFAWALRLSPKGSANQIPISAMQLRSVPKRRVCALTRVTGQ
jgi:hypothetical protein